MSSTATISVREAGAPDIPAIRSLLERASLPTESLAAGTTRFFIAEDPGGFAGVAGFEFYGKDALLRSVAVHPHLRNSGIGSQLVDWMISHARSVGLTRVVLLTETAERFFRRKGFIVVDRSSIGNAALLRSSEFASACPSSAVCMALTLGR